MKEIRRKNFEKKMNYNNELLDKIINNMNNINDFDDDIVKIIQDEKEINEPDEIHTKSKYFRSIKMIDNLIKAPLDESNDDKDAFVLKDLLEIFQGPIPKNGTIIIATTNDYDEIYNNFLILILYSYVY